VRLSVSVVICAYTEERWEDLTAAIASVRNQRLVPVEVLAVVDHNPLLLDLLHQEFAGCPDVRVLPNTGGRGLSGGRNTGVVASRGEVVAFLDDDAVADADWLHWFAEGYTDPTVMGVGGLTRPVWASGRRPPWFPEEFDWVHGASYRGMPTGRAPVRNVLGGNASFRRSAFDLAGGFRIDVGRGSDWAGNGGKRPLGGEDTELCIRIQQARADAVFLFDDRAVIHHKVPVSRERFRYFRSRCWAEGLSKARIVGRVGTDDGLATERTYLLRTLPGGVACGLRQALRGQPDGARRAAAIAAGALWTAAGYAVGRLDSIRSGRFGGRQGG
jgi:glycosyltransferase involved in cell wall biosynthesis